MSFIFSRLEFLELKCKFGYDSCSVLRDAGVCYSLSVATELAVPTRCCFLTLGPALTQQSNANLLSAGRHVYLKNYGIVRQRATTTFASWSSDYLHSVMSMEDGLFS